MSARIEGVVASAMRALQQRASFGVFTLNAALNERVFKLFDLANDKLMRQAQVGCGPIVSRLAFTPLVRGVYSKRERRWRAMAAMRAARDANSMRSIDFTSATPPRDSPR